jgi:hypothetical protein
MSETLMTPPETDLQSVATVPRWIAIVSIILGVIGLLCWAGQGTAMLLADPAELQAQGLSLSGWHETLAVAGHVVNTLLALLLLVAGVRLLNSGGQGSALLRGWAWLKLLSIAVGLVIAFLFFDELLMMNESMVRAEMAKTAQDGKDAAEASGIDEDWVKAMGRGVTIASIAIGGVVQLIWPIIVLAVVRSRND